MEHTVRIEKIITGGRGLARLASGKVVMVPAVLPDETVRLSVTKEHRGHVEAELVEVISPSPARVKPACPFYGECGGCDLQHCSYERQLMIKKQVVEESLQRAGVACTDTCPSAPIPSPDLLGYRYRLRMKVNQHGRIGYYRKQSNAFIPVTNCPVATARINEAIASLASNGIDKQIAAACREIELLQSPADDRLTLLLRMDRKHKGALPGRNELPNCPAIDQSACCFDNRIHASNPLQPLEQRFLFSDNGPISYSLFWGIGCFSQVNCRQNSRLVQLVTELAGEIKGTTILDLYCGSGNFSLPLALRGGICMGVEQNGESIKWAIGNAAKASLSDCTFFQADVARFLSGLVDEKKRFHTIILDPPRRGIGDSAALLPRLHPEKIIYISCDPATLARDLALLGKHGYCPLQLVPVDMFPQTHHIESVALLERN